MSIEAPPGAAEAHVLVFGCPRPPARTFRALVPGPAPSAHASPIVTIPSCPGCRAEHTVIDLYGHSRAPGEPVDVVLAAEPESPAALTGRQKVSDAAIIDALGAEPTPVAELASQLGFRDPGALARRARRMSERAARRGESAPVAIAGGGKGRDRAPVTLARPS